MTTRWAESTRASWRRVKAVARKETWHILRDRQLVLWSFGLPVVMLLLFGYAITLDIRAVPLIVVDPAPSQQSREIIDEMTASGYMSVLDVLPNDRRVDEALGDSKAKLALIFPVDLARRLGRGGEVPVQVVVDGSDNNTALIALGYIQKILFAHNLKLTERAFLRAGRPLSSADKAGAVEARTRIFFNPELRSRVFIIPGLLAIILGVMAVILTALCVAREYERGSMEQLIVTPIKRGELIVGKLAPYFAIGIIDIAYILIFARFVFDVPIRGSLVSIFIVSTLFLVAGLGHGLLVSIITRNQQLAMMAGLLSGLLPTIILSGFMFPVESMPVVIQYIATIVPARYYLEALRALIIKGVGFHVVVTQCLVLAGVATLFLGIAAKRFRRRVD